MIRAKQDKAYMEDDRLSFRHRIGHEDLQTIREIVTSSGYFSAEETDIAEELGQAALAQGVRSGYEFVFADLCHCNARITAGYACYGKIPCTDGSFDLYWLAMHQKYRGKGLGRNLLAMVENCVASRKGRKLFVETSSRTQYAPTRQFYRACGYEEEARIHDYYQQGEDQVIFSRLIRT
jgi:ribosomal protein S18 acetylase RimI-like enzyme